MTTWQDALGPQKEAEYFTRLLARVEAEREAGKVIYPPQQDVFNALKYTLLESVKVVILGQDPYHGPDQAHGLCFSVLSGVKTPPSLVNIYKELASDVGFTPVRHGFLESWAKQGVLLLNTALTVEQGNAASHRGKGWEHFTDRAIETVSQHAESCVFLLWGSHARQKKALIDTSRHLVLESPHPSPLSARCGFFGNHHFSRANQFLQEQGRTPIEWQLPETP